MIERGVLRRLGAAQVAGAQRLFGLLHGLFGGVEFGGCLAVAGIALRFGQALPDLRLPVGEFLAALSALLIAAAAGRALTLSLLLLLLLLHLLQQALLVLQLLRLRQTRQMLSVNVALSLQLSASTLFRSLVRQTSVHQLGTNSFRLKPT